MGSSLELPLRVIGFWNESSPAIIALEISTHPLGLKSVNKERRSERQIHDQIRDEGTRTSDVNINGSRRRRLFVVYGLRPHRGPRGWRKYRWNGITHKDE